MTALFSRALAVESGRLDVLVEKTWIGLGLAMSLASAFVAVVDAKTGLPALTIGGTILAGAVVRKAAMKAGAKRFVRALENVGEATLAPLTLSVLAIFAGPAPALYAFGPTLLFCGIVVLSIFRLEPSRTFATGLCASALSLAAALFLSSGDPVVAADPSIGPAGLVIRYVAFALVPATCAFASHGLRGAIGGAVRAMRERDLFGKYRLEKEIAHGGMGVVWSATYCPEGGFMRPAAVKLVHPHLAKDPAFVDAFRAEAELSARLVHPSIVQVFDFGRVDEKFFLAMEHVDGITLRQLMRTALEKDLAIPDPVTAAIGHALLAALGYAHREARGADGRPLHVVHRDVAPSNILVAYNGSAKLTDFGIAKILGENKAAHTTTVAGHVDYMSPEQVDAADLDERTDLFSAGVILWELVCARSLFRRPNEAATLRAVANAEIALPSTIDPARARWDAFFARALARDVAQRFASAAEMSAALRQIAQGNEDDVSSFIRALGVRPEERHNEITADTVRDMPETLRDRARDTQ